MAKTDEKLKDLYLANNKELQKPLISQVMKDYYGREYALICDVLTMLGDELRKPQNYAHKENQLQWYQSRGSSEVKKRLSKEINDAKNGSQTIQSLSTDSEFGIQEFRSVLHRDDFNSVWYLLERARQRSLLMKIFEQGEDTVDSSENKLMLSASTQLLAHTLCNYSRFRVKMNIHLEEEWMSGLKKWDELFEKFHLLKNGEVLHSNGFIDPFTGLGIHSMRVVKKFASKSEPRLLEFRTIEDRRVIFKNEDVLQDYAIQCLFFLFNQIWNCSSLPVKPVLEQFRIFPGRFVSNEKAWGLFEFVPNCCPIESITQWNDVDVKDIEFLATTAGAMIAAHVLGLRDRHKDNMLLIGEGGRWKRFLQIDFGWILGVGPAIDARCVAIPNELKALLKGANLWGKFKKIASDGFVELRKHSEIILRHVGLVLRGRTSESGETEPQLFVRNALLLNSSNLEVQTIFDWVLEGSWSDLAHTSLKNNIHTFKQMWK